MNAIFLVTLSGSDGRPFQGNPSTADAQSAEFLKPLPGHRQHGVERNATPRDPMLATFMDPGKKLFSQPSGSGRRLGASSDAAKRMDVLSSNVNEILKKLDEAKATASEKAGKAISDTTLKATQFATELAKCAKDLGSCNTGSMTGSSIDLAGSLMAAASFLTPVGEFLALAGGILAALFGQGSGPPPITLEAIGKEMHRQLVIYGAESFSQFKFPSHAQATFPPWIGFFSDAAGFITNAQYSKADKETYLRGFLSQLKVINGAFGDAARDMEEGYQHAASLATAGLRGNLLDKFSFQNNCPTTCKHNGDNKWDDKCMDDVDAGKPLWREFKALLQGYWSLANEVASTRAGLELVYKLAGWNETSHDDLAVQAKAPKQLFDRIVMTVWQRLVTISELWTDATTSCDPLYSQSCDCDPDGAAAGTCFCNYPELWIIGKAPICLFSAVKCASPGKVVWHTNGRGKCKDEMNRFDNGWNATGKMQSAGSCGKSCWMGRGVKQVCMRAEACATLSCRSLLSSNEWLVGTVTASSATLV